jgi:glutamate/tyrosine decarboxylase-like PLP-dependent enzyme
LKKGSAKVKNLFKIPNLGLRFSSSSLPTSPSPTSPTSPGSSSPALTHNNNNTNCSDPETAALKKALALLDLRAEELKNMLVEVMVEKQKLEKKLEKKQTHLTTSTSSLPLLPSVTQRHSDPKTILVTDAPSSYPPPSCSSPSPFGHLVPIGRSISPII